jgi:hypothetical protein
MTGHDMNPWAKVVTDPFGLAGFALFLVFGFLAKVKKKDERRWLSPLAVALAAVALTGSLVIAYCRVKASERITSSVQATKPAVQQQTNQQIQQTSSGAGSPNVQGVQGSVSITVDQSTGKTETKETSQTKPRPTSQ